MSPNPLIQKLKKQQDFLCGGLGDDVKLHLVNWKIVYEPIQYV